MQPTPAEQRHFYASGQLLVAHNHNSEISLRKRLGLVPWGGPPLPPPVATPLISVIQSFRKKNLGCFVIDDLPLFNGGGGDSAWQFTFIPAKCNLVVASTHGIEKI